jgi:FtsP/CotA-like multicopper oxidase with cupredoxin domain
VYEIPADHAGGTHWYHAHHHGSTALQAGGGAAGLLIVEDAADEMSAEVLAAPELAVMIANVPLPDLETVATASGDELVTSDLVQGTEGNDLFLANGAYKPTVAVQAGVATRMRMVFAAIMNELELALGDGCEWELLAKDGIPVSPAPRALGDGIVYERERARASTGE